MAISFMTASLRSIARDTVESTVRELVCFGFDFDRGGGFARNSCSVDDRKITTKLQGNIAEHSEWISRNVSNFLCLLRGSRGLREEDCLEVKARFRMQITGACSARGSTLKVAFAFGCLSVLFWENSNCLTELGEPFTKLCKKEEVHSWTWTCDCSIRALFCLLVVIVGATPHLASATFFCGCFTPKHLWSVPVNCWHSEKQKLRKIEQN